MVAWTNTPKNSKYTAVGTDISLLSILTRKIADYVVNGG
jgi:hypothetical protein